jgi:hypothetical protein
MSYADGTGIEDREKCNEEVLMCQHPDGLPRPQGPRSFYPIPERLFFKKNICKDSPL